MSHDQEGGACGGVMPTYLHFAMEFTLLFEAWCVDSVVSFLVTVVVVFFAALLRRWLATRAHSSNHHPVVGSRVPVEKSEEKLDDETTPLVATPHTKSL